MMIRFLVFRDGSNDFLGEIDLPFCPREGESLATDEKVYRVRSVIFHAQGELDQNTVASLCFIGLSVEEVK